MMSKISPVRVGPIDSITRYRFPSFTGKRVLYIGYQGDDTLPFALSEGVAEIVVTAGDEQETDSLAISDSVADAPQVHLEQDYAKALKRHRGPFDIIIFNSLAFNIDSVATLKLHWKPLIRRLSKSGVCFINAVVLESEPENDDQPCITRQQLFASLKRYAWKNIHCISSDEAELNLNQRTLNYIIQITQMKPLAYLLMSEPGSGKSTILRRLFEKQRKRIKIIKGDQTYARISTSTLHGVAVPEELATFIKDTFHRQQIGKMTDKIFAQELHPQLVEVWLQIADGGDFVLDSYVPDDYHHQLISTLKEQGYEPIVLQTHIKPPLATRSEINARLENFQQSMTDEEVTMGSASNTGKNQSFGQRLKLAIKTLLQGLDSNSKT